MDGKIWPSRGPRSSRRATRPTAASPSLEETFMAATGYSVEEASAEKE
jgi:hypothetical protein